MRTRITWETIPEVYSASDLYYANSTGLSTPRSTTVSVATKRLSFVNFVEYATDLNVGKPTFTRWNSFEHYKARSYLLSTSCMMRSWKFLASSLYHDKFVGHPLWMWEDAKFGPPSQPTVGLPALYRPTSDGHFVWPAGMDVEDLQARGLAAMLPKIRPAMSLLNSVYELKDFKRMPETIRKLYKFKSMFSDIAKHLGDTYSKWLGRKTLRKALNSTADGYLNSEFAILPLLRDISGFQTALANVDKQVKNLLLLEGRKHRRHYNATIVPTGDLIETTADSSNYIDNITLPANSKLASGPSFATFGRPYMVAQCKMRRKVSAVEAQFHSEVEFSYYLSRYQRERGRVLALMDALGVNLNPAIIWNAIPFTFILDWVLDVGSWLDQFKVQHMEPLTIIHRYLWSASVKRDITVGVFHDYNNVNFAPRYTPQIRFTESGYRREAIPPPLTAALSITGSSISLKEFILSGAMLLSKRTR